MYYIRDLGEGSGTFVKLDTELVRGFGAYVVGLENGLYCVFWRFAYARADFLRLDDGVEQTHG